MSDEEETEEEEKTETEVVRGLKEKYNEKSKMGATQLSVSLKEKNTILKKLPSCLLYTSPSPRD